MKRALLVAWLLAAGEAAPVAAQADSAWTPITVPTSDSLRCPFVLPSGEIWACGAEGRVHHYSKRRWITRSILGALPAGDSASILGVWGATDSDVWLVGSGGRVFHWNGARFELAFTARGVRSGSSFNPTISDAALFDVWGVGPNDVWAVGSRVALHWDGTAWKQYDFPRQTTTFRSVWAARTDDVWAVGDRVIAHFDGARWSERRSPVNDALRFVWGRSADDVWAAGANVYHWNGSGWTQVGGSQVSAIWQEPSGLIAASAQGLLRLSGASFVKASDQEFIPERIARGSGTRLIGASKNGRLLSFNEELIATAAPTGDAGIAACFAGDLVACVDNAAQLPEASSRQSKKRARQLDAFACERNFQFACVNEAIALSDVDDPERDPARALTLLDRACSAGDGLACYLAARQYAEGDGTARNTGIAHERYKSGCDLYLPRACLESGHMWLDQAEPNKSEAIIALAAACVVEGIPEADVLDREAAKVACTRMGHACDDGSCSAAVLEELRGAIERTCAENAPTACIMREPLRYAQQASRQKQQEAHQRQQADSRRLTTAAVELRRSAGIDFFYADVWDRVSATQRYVNAATLSETKAGQSFQNGRYDDDASYCSALAAALHGKVIHVASSDLRQVVQPGIVWLRVSQQYLGCDLLVTGVDADETGRYARALTMRAQLSPPHPSIIGKVVGLEKAALANGARIDIIRIEARKMCDAACISGDDDERRSLHAPPAKGESDGAAVEKAVTRYHEEARCFQWAALPARPGYAPEYAIMEQTGMYCGSAGCSGEIVSIVNGAAQSVCPLPNANDFRLGAQMSNGRPDILAVSKYGVQRLRFDGSQYQERGEDLGTPQPVPGKALSWHPAATCR